MNGAWFKESDNRGQNVLITNERIEWASYEIPCTSNSGGGANYYSLNELYLGSDLFNKLSDAFGESIGDEMLACAQQFIRNKSV